MCLSIQPMSMPQEYSVCWKLYASAVLRRLVASIRLQLPNFTARYRKFLRAKRPRSIPVVPTR